MNGILACVILAGALGVLAVEDFRRDHVLMTALKSGGVCFFLTLCLLLVSGFPWL